MATFRRVYHTFWTDHDIENLEPDAKLVFLNLMTNYRTSTSGIYQISFRAISNETGISVERIKEILTGRKKDNELEMGEIRNVYYDTNRGMVFVARFRIYNPGGNPEMVRKAIINEREIFSTRLWDIFDTLYDEYGKPFQNGFETVCKRFGNGSIETSNSNSIRNSIIITEEEKELLDLWLSVPGFRKAKPDRLLEKLRELSADPDLKNVDYKELAKSMAVWYEDNKKTAKNPLLALRNHAKKAVELGRDIKKTNANITEKEMLVKWAKKPPNEPDEDCKVLWKSATDLIYARIEKKEFDTWIIPTRCIGAINGEVWIAVPNGHYVNIIEENYLDIIKGALGDVGMPDAIVYIGVGG